MRFDGLAVEGGDAVPTPGVGPALKKPHVRMSTDVAGNDRF